MKNIFIQENLIFRLTFNPGLALTGFRTTRPWFTHDLIAMTRLYKFKVLNEELQSCQGRFCQDAFDTALFFV